MPDISDLKQYLKAISSNLNNYRPKCAHCGIAGLWRHGYYYRKPDRHADKATSLNPIQIFRFFCPSCRKTTSVLPECIAPRRWYMWEIQQIVLLTMLSGKSVNAASKLAAVSRQTCRRWWHSLNQRYLLHGSTLCNYYYELGYSKDFNVFWSACLQKISLSKAMLICHQSGVVVP